MAKKCRNRTDRCSREATECSGYCFECAEDLAVMLADLAEEFGRPQATAARSAWHKKGCDCPQPA